MTQETDAAPIVLERDHLERLLAGHFANNRMPEMSGDMRARCTPSTLRSVQDAALAIHDLVSARLADERRKGWEEGREAAAVEIEEQGDMRFGRHTELIAGFPALLYEAASAIRALTPPAYNVTENAALAETKPGEPGE